MDNTNPLAQYFRTPGVHQTLPTGGQFFEADEINLAINGELGILPMTAADEIVLKNPDALLNGEALIRLFRSCVPDILDPKRISVPDLDVILLAIKLASFGDNLDMEITCPKCKSEFEMTTSIRNLLGEITQVKDEDTVLRVGDDMVLYLKPYDFECKTILDLATFEESKLVQHLLDTEITDDERSKIFNKSFEKIADLNLELIARTIRYIQIPNKQVDDYEFIKEFIKNSEGGLVKLIREKLVLLSENGLRKELHVVCENPECGHEWETPMIFDPSHFFASGS